MIKLNVNKIRSSSANATLYYDQVDESTWKAWTETVGVDSEIISMDVDVDYSIEWDDDIPIVCVESVTVVNTKDGTKWVDITDLVNLEDTENQILELDDGSWDEDRLASLYDCHDILEDR